VRYQYDTAELKNRFAADPWPLLQRLGLVVDERRTDRRNIWVFDGEEHQASLAIQTAGEHAGTWTRFGLQDESGDCFTLVKRYRGDAPFHEIVEFVADTYNQPRPAEAVQTGTSDRRNGRRQASDTKVLSSQRYELRDEAGQLVAVHCRLNMSDGTKRMWYERNGQKTLGGMPPAELPLYNLGALIEDVFATKPIILVEGEKATDALRALGGEAVVALGTACGAAVTPAPPVLAHLAGRDVPVCLWPDNDAPGRKHMRAIADTLADLGVGDLRWIETEGASDRDDAADWCETHSLEELLALIDRAAAPPTKEEPTDEAPEPEAVPDPGQGGEQEPEVPIIVASGVPLQDVTRRALETVIAANDPPKLFVRDAQVTLAARSEDGRPTLLGANEALLRGIMARAARYVRMRRVGEDWVPSDIAPPVEVVKDFELQVHLWVEEHGKWPFPAITGVTECPVLRPDGTICDTPGYDPMTRLYYLPAPSLQMPPIPEEPTADDLAAAWGRLEALLGDFPFADGASHSNALALMLTAVSRPCIAGPTPLCLIDAPQAGTGKSLLVDIIAHIATGRYAAMLTAPTREEEWRKQLTSVLMGGQTFIVVDNVTRELDSGALSAALTSATISDRVLGFSRQIELPVRCTWAATGNNIRLGQDMPRRCYWVRLDARSSRPWQGREFRIPNIRNYVQEHRGELLAALLTVARAWFGAGRPAAAAVPILGSFESWCKVIGGMLHHRGDASFLKNLEALHERAAEHDNAWESFLRVWHERLGETDYTIRELAARLDADNVECEQALEEALPQELCDRTGLVNRRKLGWGLKKMEGVRFGIDSLHLEYAGQDSHSKTAKWRVVADR
jgi:hypothetical protein